MENNVVDTKIIADAQTKALEISKKALEVSSVLLKLVNTFVELFSNFSVSTIPKIAVKVAAMSNTIVDATKQIIEIKVEQAELAKNIPKINTKVKLPDYKITNPIENKELKLDSDKYIKK